MILAPSKEVMKRIKLYNKASDELRHVNGKKFRVVDHDPSIFKSKISILSNLVDKREGIDTSLLNRITKNVDSSKWQLMTAKMIGRSNWLYEYDVFDDADAITDAWETMQKYEFGTTRFNIKLASKRFDEYIFWPFEEVVDKYEKELMLMYSQARSGVCKLQNKKNIKSEVQRCEIYLNPCESTVSSAPRKRYCKLNLLNKKYELKTFSFSFRINWLMRQRCDSMDSELTRAS